MNISSWIYLIIGIPFGVLGTVCMKLSDGLRNWKPSLGFLISYGISFTALTFALQGIDVSIVYAIWSGIGTILIAIIGIALFNESVSLKKIISLILVVAGVLGIHITNAFH